MAIFVLMLLVICVQAYLLYKGSRRLLQFDTLLQRIFVTLDQYSHDLKRMTSADIDSVLSDHPEVKGFHLRNVMARAEVQSILDEVARESPPKRKKASLPRPDVE